jgi:ribosome-interacting GTPase 1
LKNYQKIYFSFLKSALVWGSSVKHNPQKVGKDHVLNDEDVVQVVKK